MKKKEESIWEKDITPHIVNFMMMDITPDFSSEVWTKDITHHVIGTLAVFGLVVSALVTTAGVAAVGVNVELAFAQQEAAAQTAALALADTPPPAMGMIPTVNGSTTAPLPPAVGGGGSIGSSTQPLGVTGNQPFCPKIMRTVARGRHEATTTGDVGQLQQFIASHYGLDPKDVVTGHFGSTTEGYLKKFQQEQGIPPASSVGPLTRAAIARLCNPSGKDPATTRGDLQRNSKDAPRHDDMMGSSTKDRGENRMPPRPPMPPMPPKAQAAPTSYNNSSSNAASVVEAMAEIGDGYGKLITASLQMFGL